MKEGGPIAVIHVTEALVYFPGQCGGEASACLHVFVIRKQNQLQSLPSRLNEQFLSVKNHLTFCLGRR